MPLEKTVPATNDTYAAFGIGISLKSNTLAVGAHFDDTNNNRIAETYIYRLKFDNGPYVATPIPDHFVSPNQPFSFTLPPGTFTDPDVNDSLTYSLGTSPTPPVWLSFNPTTGVFSGNPGATLASYPVVVVATDAEGASVSTTFNIIVTGNVPPLTDPFSLWRMSWFDGCLDPTYCGDNADPDGDGVPNIMEYVFGTNPLSADPGDTTPLIISPSGNPGTVLLTFKRRIDDPSLTYSIITSFDLINWQPLDNTSVVNLSVTPVTGGVAVQIEEVQNNFDAQFFRLVVTISNN
jgi:hypothetical protein